MHVVDARPETTATYGHSMRLILALETDTRACTAILFWLKNEGFECLPFGSLQQLAESCSRFQSFCILIDAPSIGSDGGALNQALSRLDPAPPVIIYTADDEALTSLSVARAGGYSILTKPVHPKKLADAVQAAFAGHCECLDRREKRQMLMASLISLTETERDVFDLLIRGASTKSVAKERGVTTHTVQNQRTSILQKLGCKSHMELVARYAPLQFLAVCALISAALGNVPTL